MVDATSWFAEMCTSPRPFTEDIDVLGSDHEADRTVEMCTDHRPSIEDIDIPGTLESISVVCGTGAVYTSAPCGYTPYPVAFVDSELRRVEVLTTTVPSAQYNKLIRRDAHRPSTCHRRHRRSRHRETRMAAPSTCAKIIGQPLKISMLHAAGSNDAPGFAAQ